MRILIVDDESSVLQTLMAIVKSMPGHTVRVAANAEKALEHAAALGGVDLLITDVVMQPTDGFTLRSQMAERYPDMQVVFISGYDLADYAEQIAGAPVLSKPVDAELLRSELSVAQLRLTPTPVVPQPVAPQPVVPPAPATVIMAQPAAVAKVVQAVAAQPVSAAPQPKASGVKAATPSAVVRAAVPVPKSTPPKTVPSPSSAAQPAVADPLIGVQLGDYRVQELIGMGKWGKVYAATQLSVNRRVSLKVLDSERAQDEQQRARFLADARAKAAVQHPFITPVFEADDRNGLVFFTQEYLEGADMQQRIDGGKLLDEKSALHVLKVAAEGLQYLWSHNISHSLIDASCLRLGADNIARLANLAKADADASVTVPGELSAVADIIRGLIPEKSMSGGLRALLGRMGGGPNPVTSWLVVLQAVKALEPKVIPIGAGKIKAADDAAMRAVEAARVAKKRSLYISVATLSALLLILGYVVWNFLITNARTLDEQVEIPAGSYMVGSPEEGARATLGAFEIDKYEVSINEYAKFVAWCEKNPDKEHEFDHPRGDRKASHVNEEVKTLILNAFVRGGRVFKSEGNPARGLPADPGAEIDLNSPMVGVTFWDAYAYAHWRGKILEGGAARDLPTEEEWEAAARGKRGFKYPWGDELKLDNFNSNKGYKPLSPGGVKPDDGYNYWAPVDKFRNDESEFKVLGMAGNVMEWAYRKEGNKEIPLLKGGSFASDPVPMWGRVLTIPAEDAWFIWPAANKPKGNTVVQPGISRYFVGDPINASARSLYIGFRTVKRK